MPTAKFHSPSDIYAGNNIFDNPSIFCPIPSSSSPTTFEVQLSLI